MMTMLITFFNIKGIVHFELIPQGKTVNQTYCMEIFKQLCEALYGKRPELWPSDWILHHNNAPISQGTHSVKQFLAQISITELEHPLCTHDLALNDFWLFPKIKSALKG
jgi:hypothetical protein